MASDVRMIENKSGSGSCTYFDVCKNQASSIDKYKFYPNPASNFLNIELSCSTATSLTVQMFDMAGKPVLPSFPFETTGNRLNAQIDISTLPAGIYNIVLETANGDKIITRVIIMH